MSSQSSDYFEQVYLIVEQVPNGRITTYGAIANYLGSAKGARMVGWALNKCHTWKRYVPAHRVVNRSGLLTGKKYFPGESTMVDLLKHEGHDIENNQIKQMDRVFWDPSKELE